MNAEAIVMSMLTRAADNNLPCPKNGAIAQAVDARSPATAARLISRLESSGRISVERGNTCRVVTIQKTGKRTAGTVERPHWRLSDRIKAQRASELSGPKISAHAAERRGETVQELTRVYRDPCPRCGVRGDIGCKHQEASA